MTAEADRASLTWTRHCVSYSSARMSTLRAHLSLGRVRYILGSYALSDALIRFHEMPHSGLGFMLHNLRIIKISTFMGIKYYI